MKRATLDVTKVWLGAILCLVLVFAAAGSMFTGSAWADDGDNWQNSDRLGASVDGDEITGSTAALASSPGEGGETPCRCSGPAVGLANPAAVYCEELGYEYRTVKTGDGEKGVTILPDGREYDAWAFYRGECGQEYSYCARMGLDVAPQAKGDHFATACTTCVLPDRSQKTASELVSLGAKCTAGVRQLEETETLTEPAPVQEGLQGDQVSLPAHFDWRDNGGDWMTPVKDQASCGSCWAFSAVGMVEPQYNISGGNPDLDLNLSEQHLVSQCCSNCGDCGGGWHSTALNFLQDQGITDEDCFPYRGENCACSEPYRCPDWSSRLNNIDTWGSVPSDTQTIKQYLFEKGPLSVAMGVGSAYGGYFDNGIYRCTNDYGVNHAVVIVGYDEAENCWLVRNSWGAGWNGDGHFKVGCEECSIENYVYYAQVGPAGDDADWTFMVYLDGDNNLEDAGIDDFGEMASVGSDANVNIVVQFDRINGYDSSNGDWTTCKRFLVTPGMAPTAANAVQDIGEANMGDPRTLVDFIDWAVENYPATNYALVLWNHGGGWREAAAAGDEKALALEKERLLAAEKDGPLKAVCWDDTNGGDALYMKEVQSALGNISGGTAMGLIGFDACLMGMMEVAYEIRDYGSVMVASEETEPWDGWPYDTILSYLASNPLWTPAQLGTSIVDLYYASYNGETQSAIDLSRMDTLASAISSFAQAMIDDHTNETAVQNAADSVIGEISTAVIHEKHGSSLPGSHGLAIYFPESSGAFNSDYNGTIIDFPADTAWEEFLSDFYASMGESSIQTARTASQEYYVSDYIDLYDFCEELADDTQPDMSFTESLVTHAFIGGGTARGWQRDDLSWSYDLPFSFPFFGTSYSSVYVCSNGYLDFTSSNADYSNSTSEFTNRAMIVPLWDDLLTNRSAQSNEDIYIHQPAPDSVCIRWRAERWATADPVNVEVTLYQDGRIRFNYGSGNTNLSPTIGISAGDGANYDLCQYNGSGTLTAVNSVLYTPAGGGGGTDEIGIWYPTNFTFYLDHDGSGTWNAGDKAFNWGNSSCIPLVGNWNGGAGDKIGVWYPSNHTFYLDYDGSGTWNAGDKAFNWGNSSCIPLVGNWNGGAGDKIGVWRPNNYTFYLDYNGSGTWNAGDKAYRWGNSSCTPLVGNWDGL